MATEASQLYAQAAVEFLDQAKSLYQKDASNGRIPVLLQFAQVSATLALYSPVAGEAPAPVPAAKAAPKRGNRVQ